MDFDEILKKDAFKNIEKERIDAFRKISKQLEGKSTAEAMKILMDFCKTMPKGKNITREEKMLMINAVTESLPPAEKIKFEMALKMMGEL